MASELTEKQDMFCREYLIDLNATQSAIRAGYSEKTARQIGEQNLSKLYIQERIAELKAERVERVEITADMVVRELSYIGFARVDDFVSVVEGAREIPAVESEDEHETFEPTIVKYKAVDVKVTKDISEQKIRAIASIKQGREGIEVKLHDKVKALELLGKHTGAFEKDNAQKAQPIVVESSMSTLDRLIIKYGPDSPQVAKYKQSNGEANGG